MDTENLKEKNFEADIETGCSKREAMIMDIR